MQSIKISGLYFNEDFIIQENCQIKTKSFNPKSGTTWLDIFPTILGWKGFTK